MEDEPIERAAVRLLCILYYCGTAAPQQMFGDPLLNRTYGVDSETKLQKLDFWIRYPDHLAAALLRACEPGGTHGYRREEIKQVIRQIFAANEPHLRSIPMRRFLRGAYEDLDAVYTFLSSRVLVLRESAPPGTNTEYFLTQRGSAAVQRLLVECPESIWYAERCKVINSFFGHLNGFDLRRMQYLERTYEITKFHHHIGQVTEEVRERFATLFGESL